MTISILKTGKPIIMINSKEDAGKLLDGDNPVSDKVVIYNANISISSSCANILDIFAV